MCAPLALLSAKRARLSAAGPQSKRDRGFLRAVQNVRRLASVVVTKRRVGQQPVGAHLTSRDRAAVATERARVSSTKRGKATDGITPLRPQ